MLYIIVSYDTDGDETIYAEVFSKREVAIDYRNELLDECELADIYETDCPATKKCFVAVYRLGEDILAKAFLTEEELKEEMYFIDYIDIFECEIYEY